MYEILYEEVKHKNETHTHLYIYYPNTIPYQNKTKQNHKMQPITILIPFHIITQKKTYAFII